MAEKRIQIFATKLDIVPLLWEIEEERPLQFVLSGISYSPDIEAMQSLADMPMLGNAEVGASIQLPSYLTADREALIKVRPIPQREGGTQYAVDQMANPQTIVFRPGGIYQGEILLAGAMGTISADVKSSEIFKLFTKVIRSQFTKIKSFYVGNDAMQLLRAGWRLTVNAQSPALYDLKWD